MHALGCKTNHYENQALTKQLEEAGFTLTQNIEDADVGILNTCTVTAEAGRKSRQYLRRMKKQNSNILSVAMGCHSQLEDLSEIADLVIGTTNRNNLLELISKHLNFYDEDFSIELEDDLRPIGRPSKETEYEELGIVTSQENTRAEIKIQDGCNAFCTYCAIPLARGRVRSRSRANIIREAELLVENDHKEIVLTGIHICSFEKELGKTSVALAELCLELNEIKGLERIRLGSLEPLSVNKEFLEQLRKAEKVVPHFHLSLQSGSDSVLKRMRREYTTIEYRKVVDNIREIYEEPAITTDIMVGFPEETEAEYNESLNFIEEIEFSQIHVFPYSVRPGTKAARMQQVPAEDVKKRSEIMLEKAEKLQSEYAKKFLGKEVRVVLEDNVDNYIRGFTDRYLRVYLPEETGHSGQVKNVFIRKVEKGDLFV